MNTIAFIQSSLSAGRSMIPNLLNDLKDEPLAQSTQNSGNQAL